MKNTDKRSVFTLAWQFFKQTGYTFSECLKKAWANIKLKAKMKSQIVEFHYKKFLDEAVLKFKISIEEARKKYGLYTYGQWQELLKNNSK